MKNPSGTVRFLPYKHAGGVTGTREFGNPIPSATKLRTAGLLIPVTFEPTTRFGRIRRQQALEQAKYIHG